eukprot:890308-Prymnesium_polylepis.1
MWTLAFVTLEAPSCASTRASRVTPSGLWGGHTGTLAPQAPPSCVCHPPLRADSADSAPPPG